MGVEVARVVLPTRLQRQDRVGECLTVENRGQVASFVGCFDRAPVELVVDHGGCVFNPTGGDVLSALGVDDTLRWDGNCLRSLF